MTLSEAYAVLKARWPRETWAVSHELWHHDHSDSTGDPATRTEEYCVWNAVDRVHYYGPTMENALEQALGEAVERQILPFSDGSGYEIKGRLMQVKGGAA